MVRTLYLPRMDAAVMMRLPRYARGLKLVRLGVFLMLLQLGVSIVMTLKGLGASTPEEAFDAIKWVQYFLWVNIAATVAMLVGNLLALPDFALARISIHLVLIAVVGFAIASLALWWSHHVISAFVKVALDPDSSAEDVLAVADGLRSLKLAATVKDLSYVIGLIAVLRAVRQFAVANDQLALRDLASNLTGLLVIMLVGDLFYQLTYGLGSGGGALPIVGLFAAVTVGGYWIYCHLRLQRFLENAAYFVNEPHHLPAATLVNPGTIEADAPTPRPSARAITKPSVPSSTASAPVIVVAPELRPAPAPRAESSSEGDPADVPRFLR